MKVIVLGSGSAYGSPMIFNNWRNLSSKQSKNIRNRASIYMEIEGKKFIIDTGPEFRLQVNQNGITDLDAIFITHGHYDHIASLPELSRACTLLNHPIEIWSSQETQTELKQVFGFMFKPEAENSPSLLWRSLPDCGNFESCGVTFETFQVKHHHLHCSAFRYKDFAYVTDWEQMPEESINKLQGVSTLLIECNNGLYPEKNGHSDIENVKAVAAKIKPQRVILTHLSARVDYDELRQALPQGFEVAYDGMEINI